MGTLANHVNCHNVHSTIIATSPIGTILKKTMQRRERKIKSGIHVIGERMREREKYYQKKGNVAINVNFPNKESVAINIEQGKYINQQCFLTSEASIDLVIRVKVSCSRHKTT